MVEDGLGTEIQELEKERMASAQWAATWRAHGFDVELLGNRLAAGLPEGAGAGGVQEQRLEGVGQRIQVMGVAKKTATGGLNDFRKSGVGRLDDRDAEARASIR